MAMKSIESANLSEFARSFNWAMCRNTLCEHFGIPYTGPVPEQGGKAGHDNRYRLDSDGRMRCKYCGLSFNLKSNAAVRTIARYYLSLSLPFATCPDVTCENHGYNVFEHYVERDSPHRAKRRYGREGEYRTRCVRCRTRFLLGNALDLNDALDVTRSMKTILKEVMKQQSITNILEDEDYDLSVSAYYGRLEKVAVYLREYHAWRTARLLDPRLDIDRRSPVRIYTDTMQVSLKRLGVGPRHKFLDIIMSVLALERRGFILAAHPCFLPVADDAGDTGSMFSTLINARQPGARAFEDDWDFLSHPGKITADEINDPTTPLPDVSRGGYFTSSPYAEAAHFLVVQKMLSRFDQVYYYMDAARDLYPAALCVLAEPVRAGKAEIALFQHEKKKRREGLVASAISNPDDSEKVALLLKEDKAMERRFKKKVKPKKGELPLSQDGDRKRRASFFKLAVKGGNSESGCWAWLNYPPEGRAYKNCRSLWLTRMPHKRFEDTGGLLLFHANLQPVDTLMSSMRRRIRAVARPEERAEPGPSYLRSYFRIDTVMSEVWIYLLRRNYRLRRRTKQKRIPAEQLGLMTDKEAARVLSRPIPDAFLHIVKTFRLGLSEAARMTKWMG